MSDFSHRPAKGDKFPIEVPPGSGFERFLHTLGGFFKGIGRGLKHIFSDDYCELLSFNVGPFEKVDIPAAGGVAAAVARRFTITAKFSGDGAEDAYEDGAGRLIPRGYRSQLGVDVDNYSPDQSGGCTYHSEDAPQIPAEDEQAHLEFLGMIIDTCEGRIIDIQAWSVDLP